ncbi:hypothetical protein DSM21852_38540 [Methylocystis bryophila]|uniref:PepSY domain-containing protein n=1 Tax=Methylocystis bryophila TaxID=655015 RepID=A0A1W6MSF9_9HYPH|nr:hypothetical protein B1812_05145 [Methylocystis bryophila]BDV40601.1 hypothetical protein DSM21852_38540 [Methylocystis bryophila]
MVTFRCGTTIRIVTAGAALVATSVVRAEETSPNTECYTVAQTREKIAQHGLADPVPLLRKAGAENQGEPLAARLCRNGEVFIYDITVMRRDGRIERVPINAADGKPQPRREKRP